MCASLSVLNRPVKGAMKVRITGVTVSPTTSGKQHPPAQRTNSPGRSESVYVGTRKMVNYA